MENKEICSKCKGKCCKTMGCHYSPKDFEEISFEYLMSQIDKGYISIDWWEGNPFEDNRNIHRAFFLRVRNVESPIVDPSWGGRCSLLTETGCSLTYNERPTGGRLLIPGEKNCVPKYTKEDCVKEWYKYNDILIKLYENYCKPPIPVSLLEDIDRLIKSVIKNKKEIK